MSLSSGQTLLKLGMRSAFSLPSPSGPQAAAAIIDAITPFIALGKMPVPGGFIPTLPTGAPAAKALLMASYSSNKATTAEAADDFAQSVALIAPVVPRTGMQALKRGIQNALDSKDSVAAKTDAIAKSIGQYYSAGGAI